MRGLWREFVSFGNPVSPAIRAIPHRTEYTDDMESLSGSVCAAQELERIMQETKQLQEQLKQASILVGST